MTGEAAQFDPLTLDVITGRMSCPSLAALHTPRQHVAKQGVPHQFIHMEDVAGSGRIAAFGVVLDPSYLPACINQLKYPAALNQREGKVPGHVSRFHARIREL